MSIGKVHLLRGADSTGPRGRAGGGLVAPARPNNRGEVYLISIGKFTEGDARAGYVKQACAAISNGGFHKLGL